METICKIMLPDRFWDKVTTSNTNFYKDTPCMEWSAFINPSGYGKFWFNGKNEQSHRLSYEDKYGKIQEGLVINHLCRNRSCVNPNHLEDVTQQENIQKGLTGFAVGLRMRTKTHCPQGHEYNDQNTYISPNGSRNCRACILIQVREYQHRKKLEVDNKS